MTLSATNYTLSNAYIGSIEYDNYKPTAPVIANGSASSGTNEQPTVEIPNKYTSLQKIEIYGAISLGVLLFILLLLCIVVACK